MPDGDFVTPAWCCEDGTVLLRSDLPPELWREKSIRHGDGRLFKRFDVAFENGDAHHYSGLPADALRELVAGAWARRV